MRRLLAFAVLLLLGFTVARADDRSNLEKQARQDYEGKTLILRTFYDGPDLRFDAAGNKLLGGDPGPWTVDAQVQVEKVRLSGDKLEFDGKRLFLVYDQKSKKFEDALEWVSAHLEGDRRKASRDLLQSRQKVRIVLELPPGDPTREGLQAAVQKVFLAPEEHLADFVPPYWHNLVRDLYGGAVATAPPAYAGGGVFRVGGAVKPPHATYEPDPEFTDIARVARYQGTVVLRMIIGPDGEVREARIELPLGLGLDENAVAAVRTWKFQPALKDGQPVAVVMQVETNFHLY